MPRRTLTRLSAIPLLVATRLVVAAVTARPAKADGCHTWGRTLSETWSASSCGI